MVFGGGTQAQFVRFCAIGIGSGVLDFCTYRTALYLAVATVPAKALGYIAGTSFSVLANHRWTFGGNSGPGRIASAFGLYFISLGLNVLVNQLGLYCLGRSEMGIALAFLTAVACCTIFNFMGMKLFIFRRLAE